jgi:hypothetical protein
MEGVPCGRKAGVNVAQVLDGSILARTGGRPTDPVRARGLEYVSIASREFLVKMS